MTQNLPDLRADEFRHLCDDVQRIAGILSSLARADPTSTQQAQEHGDPEEMAAELVSWIIMARELRSRFLPTQLFADPAWDILLDLLRAELARERVSVSSACIAANVPATTAMRYIKTMVQQGLLVREHDPYDGRRTIVRLAPTVSEALRSYFARLSLSNRRYKASKTAIANSAS